MVFTLANINDKANPAAGKLYLNGKLQGTIEKWIMTFDWDPKKVLLVLGSSYVGYMDDLAVFNRPLTDVEVIGSTDSKTAFASCIRSSRRLPTSSHVAVAARSRNGNRKRCDQLRARYMSRLLAFELLDDRPNDFCGILCKQIGPVRSRIAFVHEVVGDQGSIYTRQRQTLITFQVRIKGQLKEPQLLTPRGSRLGHEFAVRRHVEHV